MQNIVTIQAGRNAFYSGGSSSVIIQGSDMAGVVIGDNTVSVNTFNTVPEPSAAEEILKEIVDHLKYDMEVWNDLKCACCYASQPKNTQSTGYHTLGEIQYHDPWCLYVKAHKVVYPEA